MYMQPLWGVDFSLSELALVRRVQGQAQGGGGGSEANTCLSTLSASLSCVNTSTTELLNLAWSDVCGKLSVLSRLYAFRRMSIECSSFSFSQSITNGTNHLEKSKKKESHHQTKKTQIHIHKHIHFFVVHKWTIPQLPRVPRELMPEIPGKFRPSSKVLKGSSH